MIKSPSPQGRSLRSGRTIPEHQVLSEPPSPLSVGNGQGEEEEERASDRDYNNDGWDSARYDIIHVTSLGPFNNHVTVI